MKDIIWKGWKNKKQINVLKNFAMIKKEKFFIYTLILNLFYHCIKLVQINYILFVYVSIVYSIVLLSGMSLIFFWECVFIYHAHDVSCFYLCSWNCLFFTSVLNVCPSVEFHCLFFSDASSKLLMSMSGLLLVLSEHSI